MLSAKRKAARAERLSWLESEDVRISRALHELTCKRQQYQQEARSLRLALTAEERALYDALRSMRAPDGRLPDPARLGAGQSRDVLDVSVETGRG